jgi:hypothetical protein
MNLQKPQQPEILNKKICRVKKYTKQKTSKKQLSCACHLPLNCFFFDLALLFITEDRQYIPPIHW